MENQTMREITRHLIPALAGDGNDKEQDVERRNILFWALGEIAEPEPETIWLPDNRADAHWLTAQDDERRPYLMTLSARVPEPPPADSTQPHLTVKTKGTPLDDRWTVELESEYGALAPKAGFRTRWGFQRDGETVVRIEGERKLMARHFEEWWTDDAEVFARLLASRVGWAERSSPAS